MKVEPNHIGRVQYEDRFKQPLLFDGMNIGKMYPTDIDAITEYHDMLYMIMEVKREGVPLNRGQTTALIRLVNAVQETGRTAVLFICRHDIADPSQPIFLKDTIITEAYFKGDWYDLNPRTALYAWNYAMDWARRKEDKERYKSGTEFSSYPFS